MEIDSTLVPTIIIDDRESASGIADYLRERDIFEIQQCRLEVGDYVIGHLGIERKTGADFVASILDGRLFRQILLLKRLFFKRALLLEGDVPSDSKLSAHAVLGAKLKIMGALQVPIVHSANCADSARMIERLAVHMFGFGHSSIRGGPTNGAAASFHQVYVLAGIPGIGIRRAKELVEHFGSLTRIFSASEAELSAVHGIGPVGAQRIFELVNYVNCRPKNLTPGGQ